MSGENSKNFYPYAQYMKMKKGRRWSTYGECEFMEVIEDYAGQCHFGEQLMVVMETQEK